GTDPFGETVTAKSHDKGKTPGTPTTTTVQKGSSALDLRKESKLDDKNGNTFADAGETITYTLTVRNLGDVALSGVVVKDDKIGFTSPPADLAAKGQKGDTKIFTAAYKVTAQDLLKN